MSQNEELNVEALEVNVEATVEATETKRSKKEVTAEDVALLEESAKKLVSLGIISEELSRFIPLVGVWHDKEASADVKTLVALEFATEGDEHGTTALKDFASGPMAEEIESLKGIDKALSKLNLIRSFYARRPKKEGTGSTTRKSRKTQQISISGEYYDVNQDFYNGLDAAMSRDEKVAAILAHPQTKKSEVIDSL